MLTLQLYIKSRERERLCFFQNPLENYWRLFAWQPHSRPRWHSACCGKASLKGLIHERIAWLPLWCCTYIYFCGGALAMPIASFRTKLQLPLEQPIHTGPQMELKNAYFQAIRSPLIDAQSKSQRHLKNWFCY